MKEEGRFAIKECITGKEIQKVRKRCGLSRKELADLFKVSVRTVEYWENGKTPVSGPVVFGIRVLSEYPETVQMLEIPSPETPLRLIYKKAGEVCTVIDVDERHQKVFIRNYTNDVDSRAFGVNGEPDYAQYEEFLKSRCFPETVDKRKVLLEHLGLPFYDPLMIIEKTEGRLHDDDFHIEVIRK